MSGNSPVRSVVLLALGTVLPFAMAWGQQAATPKPHGPLFQDCRGCHRPDAWRPARITREFLHPPAFPLRGAHGSTTCRSCHLRLDFTNADPACASCHADPHGGELGRDCARCHTTASFVDRGAMLRSHQLTRFPLAGAHRMADCESCHLPAAQGQRRFSGRPTDCASCHERQLHVAKTPDHIAAGFSRNCGSCHTPTYWNRAAFDHAGTRFPLTGAHRPQPCSACHGDGVYRGKPATCVSCHQPDYDATTNPNHASAGFPTDCAGCHTTARWQGATFDHDARFFPIYSGAHRGRWASCATCHVNPASFAEFTCLSCHGQTTTNEHHKEVPGYSYTSPACYSCHRNGRSP